MTLTGTVNPDFGQVEADPAVVNLGAFETFFEERRPFFVEGSGNFSFNNLLLLAPHRPAAATVDVGARRWLRQRSRPTRRCSRAAKLTGRVGAFAVGALNAVTAAEHATVASGPALARSTSPVEPTTSYSVARASREFANKSRLSFMMTSTNRRLTDELRFLPQSAYTGAVDGDWRLASDRVQPLRLLGGQLGARRRRGDRSHSAQQRAQLPAAGCRTTSTTIRRERRSTATPAARASARSAARRTRGNVNIGYRSPGFEINDLGFQSRADEIWQNAWFQIRSEHHGKYIRYKNINFNQWSGFNFGGDRRQLGYNVNSHWTFNSGWGFGSGFNYNTERFDDRLTRGGPGGADPAQHQSVGLPRHRQPPPRHA